MTWKEFCGVVKQVLDNLPEEISHHLGKRDCGCRTGAEPRSAACRWVDGRGNRDGTHDLRFVRAGDQDIAVDGGN
jgi:hypothetical protein